MQSLQRRKLDRTQWLYKCLLFGGIIYIQTVQHGELNRTQWYLCSLGTVTSQLVETSHFLIDREE